MPATRGRPAIGIVRRRRPATHARRRRDPGCPRFPAARTPSPAYLSVKRSRRPWHRHGSTDRRNVANRGNLGTSRPPRESTGGDPPAPSSRPEGEGELSRFVPLDQRQNRRRNRRGRGEDRPPVPHRAYNFGHRSGNDGVSAPSRTPITLNTIRSSSATISYNRNDDEEPRRPRLADVLLVDRLVHVVTVYRASAGTCRSTPAESAAHARHHTIAITFRTGSLLAVPFAYDNE